jgi:hypothetical protein
MKRRLAVLRVRPRPQPAGRHRRPEDRVVPSVDRITKTIFNALE